MAIHIQTIKRYYESLITINYPVEHHLKRIYLLDTDEILQRNKASE